MKKVQRPDSQQGDHQVLMYQPVNQGMLTLILKREVSVQLTSLSLLVRNQLYHDLKLFFPQFQNNLVLTGKDEEVSRTNTPPS